MDTVDLEEMGLIDGCSTFISEIADSQPILYAPDGTISISSDYLSNNGNRVTYVTIPSLVQMVQDAETSEIGYLINNNQIRINRPIILNEDSFIDAAENSADENFVVYNSNQTSDYWTAPNHPTAAHIVSSEEDNRSKSGNKVSTDVLSKKKDHSNPCNEEVDPPDKMGPLFCELCGLEFTSWKLFKKHKVKHLHEKPYKCDSCRESFNYENNLILHMATHNVENPFCPICKKKFNRIAGLKAHILLHEQEESLFCNECGEEFSSSVFLDEHLREHRISGSEQNKKKYFKCNNCSAMFETFVERKEHLKDFHKSTRNRKMRKYSYNNRRKRGNNVCEYCAKCFEKPSQLLRHKRIHTGERPFKCELCTRAFNQKGSLQIHMLKHTRERPYICQYCQGTFSQKGNLQAHIKRLHFSSDIDERNFKCKLCSCVFRKLGSLNAHFTKAHTLAQQGTPKKIETKKADCAKKCELNISADSSDTSNKENELEKAGDGKKVLVTVTNEHEEDDMQEITLYHVKVKKTKLHSCSYCQKEFKRSSDLVRHIRMHTQEKPFKCKMCSKSFALSSNLAVHLKNHSRKTSEHKESGEIPLDRGASLAKKVNNSIQLENVPHLEETSDSNFVCLTESDVSAFHCDLFVAEEGSIVNANSKVVDKEKEKNKFVEGCWKCKDCDLMFKKISLLKAHRLKHHNEVHYKCNLCPCAFKTSKLLKEHVESHSSIMKYVCEHCGKMFLSEDSLKRHGETHLTGFPWACPVCGAGFKSFDACRRHISCHPKIGPIKYKPMAVDCIDEKKINEEISFIKEPEVANPSEQIIDEKNQNNLPNDINDFINSLQPGQQITITANGALAISAVTSHESIDEQYTIVEGKKELNSPPSVSQKQLYDNSLDNCIILQQNIEMGSQVIGPAISAFLPQTQAVEKCDVSNLVFTNETDYTVHKTIHTEEKPHTCVTCDRSFFSALEYEEHAKCHSKKGSVETKEQHNVETVTSISTVKSQAVLLKNVSEKKKARLPWRPPARRLTDEEAKILSAIDSNTASVSEKVLLQSLLEKEKYEHPIQEETKAPEKHQHRCKYCPKTFKKPSDLIRHLRTHTGERPFQCTSCHKRFSIKSTASSHMKTHTKDRSFSCFVCNKNFATTGSLKIHMRLHTGLKPFSCNLCDAKFRTSGHKKAHMKKHLKESSNEEQNGDKKCNEIDAHFLDNILKQAEYLNPSKPSTNEIVSVDGVEGSQYLVPLRAQNIMSDLTGGNTKSVADYLINIDEAGDVMDESPQYLLSLKDDNDGDSFIVEKLCDDQIIVTIAKGNSTILSSSNSNVPSTSVTDQGQLKIEEKFSCSFCKKKFAKHSTLKKHIQKYHGEPYHCTVCSCKFERKCDLELHSLTHELERDFTCSECAESFSLEEDLRAHKCPKGESLELALDHDLFLFPPV